MPDMFFCPLNAWQMGRNDQRSGRPLFSPFRDFYDLWREDRRDVLTADVWYRRGYKGQEGPPAHVIEPFGWHVDPQTGGIRRVPS